MVFDENGTFKINLEKSGKVIEEPIRNESKSTEKDLNSSDSKNPLTQNENVNKENSKPQKNQKIIQKRRI